MQPYVGFDGLGGDTRNGQEYGGTSMKTESTFHRIKNLKVTGGFLAGIDLTFKDGLNCIIGPRGSGKSTTEELIRYSLGVLPGRDERDPLRKRIQTLVESTLGGGRVELVIETKDGMTYTVSRAAGEEPVLVSSEGTILPSETLRSQIFPADIYSQNQIESIAETPHYQLDLLDKFKESELRAVQSQLDETTRKLKSNAAQILPLLSEKTNLLGELTQLEAVREKLKSFAKSEGQDSEVMNRVHAAKALRDREMKAIDHARVQLADFKTKLGSFVGYYGAQAVSFFGDDMRVGANQLVTGEAIEIIKAGVAVAEKAIAGALTALTETESKIGGVRTRLEQAHATQEMEYRKVIEKQQQNQAQSVERAKVEKQHNDLLFKQKRVDELNQNIKGHSATRDRLLAQLSEERDRRFEIRNQIAITLTDHLKPNIKVSVEQNADQESYRKLLENSLRSGSMQHQKIAASLSSALTPQELGELARKDEPLILSKRGSINPEQAKKVIAELRNPEKLMELEIVDLDDLPKIELSDGGIYKNSAGLSTGQKCTAILPILMFDSANPLLIDQPEDNLDNRYVYECIVATVKKVKSGRQLIFVTHNPNIPVLGDAEQIVVMQSDGRSGSVHSSGNVDECRDSIINLLEGGSEAFRLRSERYDAQPA